MEVKQGIYWHIENIICEENADYASEPNMPHIVGHSPLMEKFQMSPDPDYSELIDNKSTKIIQSVVGTMLYYIQSVHPKMIQEIS